MSRRNYLLLAALLPMTSVAVTLSNSASIDLEVEAGICSAYLCRGHTFCDGWMNDQGLYFSNLRIGDTVVPIYGGYWGIMHLEETPEEKYSFGKWSEMDFWLGVNWGHYIHERLTLETDFLVCALPEVRDYDAMCGVNVNIGWKCWLSPRLHIRNRIMNSGAGKWEISFSCGHRWELPYDFWTSLRETCWAVDYRNVDAETPSSGFTALDTRCEIGWKCLYVGLDVIAQLDDAALPHRRGQYYRPIVFSAGVRWSF